MTTFWRWLCSLFRRKSIPSVIEDVPPSILSPGSREEITKNFRKLLKKRE